ncbi:MAG: PQQ-like beta-propeller repeat protein [Pirellulaceae bacterium]|nr:PQQ-like beta-propeller repeat protein [Pirellulaceae bacterium]
MSDKAQPSKSFFRRFLIPIVLIDTLIVIEIINWSTNITSEVLMPQFGAAAQTVLGRMVAFLFGGLLLLWLLFTRQVGRKPKAIVFGCVALIAAGLAASIRTIENTGDNGMVIHYRWQPTPEQRLASYQRSASKESPPAIPLDPSAPQMTNFLGPARDGIIPGRLLNSNLSQTAPRELWRRPMGGGYAACVLAGGVAVTIDQRGEEEVVVALDLKTGQDRWTRGYAGHFIESMGGNGPRATPTIAGDEVFALGASGLLVALDLATGNEKWKTNILEDAGAQNIKWGMCGAPLVTADKVIVNPGGAKDSGLVAYDRATGQKRWSGGGSEAGYASPVLGTIHGSQQVVIFDAVGVAGHDLENGAELWRFSFPTFNGINCGQPLVLPDNRVFISAGYDAGSVLLQIGHEGDQWTVAPVWRSKRLKCKMGTVIVHEGFAYGLDDGILCCVDMNNGERKWKSGRYGHGQILLRGTTLVIQAESGDLVLVAAEPERHRELAKIPMLPGGKTWNAPALADNLLLLRNHFEAVLLEMPVAEQAEPL